MEQKQKQNQYPTIVVVGKSGSGKSHLCHHFLSAKDPFFKTGDDLVSETFNFDNKEIEIFGDESGLYANLVDTIGLKDNRVLTDLFSKQGKFMKDIVDWGGISSFIFTIDMLGKRAEPGILKRILKTYGDNLLPRMLIVLMRGELMLESERLKQENKYKSQLSEIYSLNKIISGNPHLKIFAFHNEDDKKKLKREILDNLALKPVIPDSYNQDVINQISRETIIKDEAAAEFLFLQGQKYPERQIQDVEKNIENEKKLYEEQVKDDPENKDAQKRLDIIKKEENKLKWGNLGFAAVGVLTKIASIFGTKVAENGFTTFAKFIPGIGLVVGTGKGCWRLYDNRNDWWKPLFEVASGAASIIPIWGTGISVGIEAGLFGADTFWTNREEEKDQKKQG